MLRNAKKKKKYTGPMRLPQQTIPLSRAPFSDPTGGLRDVEMYAANATSKDKSGDITWHVEIIGRPPTQRERDVLEMLFAVGEPIEMNGTIGYRFEAYGFLRRLEYQNPGERDVTWLRDTLRRWIRPISLTASDGSAWHDFALLTDAKSARVGHGRDVRWMVAAVVSPAYVQMLRTCMHLSYHALVPQIVALPNDLSKAIARTMLGHDFRHRTLTEVLADLGIDAVRLADRTRKKYVRQVLDAEDGLAGLGITLEKRRRGFAGMKLHMVSQPDGVYTAEPAKSIAAPLLALPAPTRMNRKTTKGHGSTRVDGRKGTALRGLTAERARLYEG